MRLEFISESGSRRLIAFFAGWGMDRRPFQSLHKDGYDVAVVYDYTTCDIDIRPLAGYDEIVVVAWSMGVWFADYVMIHNPALPFTRCIAVNGTLWPIDGRRGIERDIFVRSGEGGIAGFARFYRRVCGGAAGQKRFMPVLPERDPEGMKEELMSIVRSVESCEAGDPDIWDEIVVSGHDLIFPPEAMNRAWAGARGKIRYLPDAEHIVDFQELLDRHIVDKDLVSDRFAGASATYDNNADVQRQVASRLVGMARKVLGDGVLKGLRILEIGAGAGMLTRMYLPVFSGCEIVTWDISGVPPVDSADNDLVRCRCDAETEVLKSQAETFDIIFSSSTIQWFNSPRRFVGRMIRLLRPGGRAFLSCFGPGTFADMEDGQSFEGLDYPSFDKPFLDSLGVDYESSDENIVLGFGSPAEALRHLRATGVNSLRRAPLGVSATRALMKRLSDDRGGAGLTFNALYYTFHKTVKKES